jgi:hypothetical protein
MRLLPRHPHHPFAWLVCPLKSGPP